MRAAEQRTVRVGEHNVGRLAAEFERDALQVRLVGRVGHDLADLRAAREGHLVDLHVRRDRRARRRPVARDHVHDTRRKARLLAHVHLVAFVQYFE